MKIDCSLSQFPHPSSSPNSEELTGWSAWPQHWCRPLNLFLPQKEKQKQWSQMVLSVQQVVVVQQLWVVCPEKISYEQSYNQHVDQLYNNN
jgi:hypothetical protein